MVRAGPVCCTFHAEPGQKDYRAVGGEVLKIDAVPGLDVPGIDFLSVVKGYGVEGVSAATATGARGHHPMGGKSA